MNSAIVDTNVAVIANRQNSEVVDHCVDICVEFISKIRTEYIVLIDAEDEIRAEYANALRLQRPYEIGGQFLFYVLQQQFNTQRVRKVKLEKNDAGEFVDFPVSPDLKKFDLSDRKFAALSKKTNVPVTNATDSDWVEYFEALKNNGIKVNFLCGCIKNSWFK